jgi:hypothetical protein
MQRINVVATLVLMSVLAAPYDSVAAERVGKIEAWDLAMIYASRYLPDECVADSATLHRDHWESKVTVVIAKGQREPVERSAWLALPERCLTRGGTVRSHALLQPHSIIGTVPAMIRPNHAMERTAGSFGSHLA